MQEEVGDRGPHPVATGQDTKYWILPDGVGEARPHFSLGYIEPLGLRLRSTLHQAFVLEGGAGTRQLDLEPKRH